ncbi:acyl carrier protein [Sporosalibacterium faouarense]|uniref:acyl carrier protein n=1 Tax=Sporosalibacterium faouarense TaxID=516123 RepID=UPI00141C7FE6|nr:acyl carrier protein [Sporosalibacterium faouarense]MTI46796.1 acyl carrier protein [Bacillota bacterium]
MKELESIRRFITDNLILQDVEIDLDTELFNSGLIDSFALLDLVCYIEDEFNVKIKDYEIVENNANTVIKIGDMIKERL